MPTLPSTPTPDPLLESQLVWVRYKTPILAGLLVIIFGAIAYGGWHLYSARREAAAATMLAQATTASDFQQVIDRYGSTGAGPSAYLFFAAEQRKQQKYAEANSTLQNFTNRYPHHQFITTAKMAMAANLESLGKTDEALDAYRRVAAEYPRDFNAPLAMLAQVHLLKAKGQVDQARQVCETVLTQYRESAAANEAAQLLRTLKPPTAAEPASAPASPAPTANASATPVASVSASPRGAGSPAASAAPKP